MRTEEKTYQTKEGKGVHMVWLQRGRSEGDQTFNTDIIIAHDVRGSMRTSKSREGDPRHRLQVLTLVGTVATIFGFLLQFIV